MKHGDAEGAHAAHSVWISERKKSKKVPAAAVGHMGTMADCIAGDVVACESVDGRDITWAKVAWQWPDGKAAQVRVYDKATKDISSESEFLVTVLTTQRVRFLGIRAK